MLEKAEWAKRICFTTFMQKTYNTSQNDIDDLSDNTHVRSTVQYIRNDRHQIRMSCMKVVKTNTLVLLLYIFIYQIKMHLPTLTLTHSG
jgi:hypothetical protein